MDKRVDSYVLQTSELTKSYKNQIALDRVDLAIRRGAIYGFIGQNGAGKSTLMRIAAGLAKPTSGKLELFGCDEGPRLIAARRKIGVTIETPALFPHMTAAENLETFRLQKGLRDKGCIGNALRLTGLEQSGNKAASEFSLGMKQRLGLAIALLGNPELLILDEPTNGLDPVGVVELRELLLRLNREEGISILISSHILSELHLLATDYGIIHHGRMLQQLSAAQLEANCRTYLYIRTDNPDKSLEMIRSKWGAAECRLEQDGAVLLYGSPASSGEIATSLFEAGIEVRQLTPSGEKLEGYYTKLIGGDRP